MLAGYFTQTKYSAILHYSQGLHYCPLELREVIPDYSPNSPQFYPHILVDRDIPEAGTPASWNIRAFFLQKPRDPFCGLTDDLKVSYHCILSHL